MRKWRQQEVEKQKNEQNVCPQCQIGNQNSEWMFRFDIFGVRTIKKFRQPETGSFFATVNRHHLNEKVLWPRHASAFLASISLSQSRLGDTPRLGRISRCGEFRKKGILRRKLFGGRVFLLFLAESVGGRVEILAFQDCDLLAGFGSYLVWTRVSSLWASLCYNSRKWLPYSWKVGGVSVLPNKCLDSCFQGNNSTCCAIEAVQSRKFPIK